MKEERFTTCCLALIGVSHPTMAQTCHSRTVFFSNRIVVLSSIQVILEVGCCSGFVDSLARFWLRNQSWVQTQLNPQKARTYFCGLSAPIHLIYLQSLNLSCFTSPSLKGCDSVGSDLTLSQTSYLKELVHCLKAL